MRRRQILARVAASQRLGFCVLRDADFGFAEAAPPRRRDGLVFDPTAVIAFICRVVSAVQKPRAAPAQLFAALSQTLIHGFFIGHLARGRPTLGDVGRSCRVIPSLADLHAISPVRRVAGKTCLHHLIIQENAYGF